MIDHPSYMPSAQCDPPQDIIWDILERKHPYWDWALLREFHMETGRTGDSLQEHGAARRSIDAWAISYWHSLGYQRIAYEIKRSRPDWLRELKDPNKQKFAWSVSHELWVIAPKGCILVAEVPGGWGFYEIVNGRCYTRKKAMPHEPLITSNEMIAMTARRTDIEELRQQREHYMWLIKQEQRHYKNQVAANRNLDRAYRALCEQYDIAYRETHDQMAHEG